jgi:26S proteasome regulatory subunit N5
MLAEIKEEEGNIKEAGDLLQEVQIETVGSMEPREKIEFILEQMRLVLDNNDFVRAQLISKKITTRSLSDASHQDLKVRYYKLMIRYYTHEQNYLEICRCWHAIYDTPSIQENNTAWAEALESMVLFVILSPFDNHQHDLMNRIWTEKKLEEKPLALYRELLRLFISNEVINWPEFEQKYGTVLANNKVFVDDKSRWQDLHNRVVEHNIRIISKYFSKVTMKRLAQLLFLSEQSTESFVSKMVSSKTIRAKIDRLDGIITFKQPQETVEALNNWSSDIVQLLSLVEKSVHLINSATLQAKQSNKTSSV